MYRKDERKSISAFLKRSSNLLGHFEASLTINKLILMNLISFYWRLPRALRIWLMGLDDYLQQMAIISHYKKLFFSNDYYTMRQSQKRGMLVSRPCRDLKTFSFECVVLARQKIKLCYWIWDLAYLESIDSCPQQLINVDFFIKLDKNQL